MIINTLYENSANLIKTEENIRSETADYNKGEIFYMKEARQSHEKN